MTDATTRKLLIQELKERVEKRVREVLDIAAAKWPQGRRGKHIFFVQLAHDEHGEAKLPCAVHDTLVRRAHEADKRA